MVYLWWVGGADNECRRMAIGSAENSATTKQRNLKLEMTKTTTIVIWANDS